MESWNGPWHEMLGCSLSDTIASCSAYVDDASSIMRLWFEVFACPLCFRVIEPERGGQILPHVLSLLHAEAIVARTAP